MRVFRKDESGYILVLGLLVMPVFIGFGLLIIDVGRGNNAHADLSAAADAVALAGARELDGGTDAIDRARVAMAQITNSVAMLSRTEPGQMETLVYADAAGNEFEVVFLTTIPDNDTDPIDFSFATADGTQAEYVYVRAQSIDLESNFTRLFSQILNQETVPVAAVAVATALPEVICDVPPLYICNPFEFDGAGNYVGDEIQNRFAAGDFHARMIKLHPKGSDTPSPGNFGFLSVNGSSSADAIRDIFAGARNPTCYPAGTVRTSPGAANSISQGVNTRFDIYTGSFSNYNPNSPNAFPIGPAENVRKGIRPDVLPNGTVNHCFGPSSGTLGDDHIMGSNGLFNANGVDDEVFGFPDNLVMTPPNQGVQGAFAGVGEWDAQNYLDQNYGAGVVDANLIPRSFAGTSEPSRYDVYRYELANDLHLLTSPGGESGEALCGPNKNQPINPITATDRRVMVAAIIDCGQVSGAGGGVTDFPVNSFASIFLTRPMISPTPGQDATIDIEIIDITGFGGNGTLDDFVRAEAVLVR
ncbi:pilus assembly protein TadG-related protein [Roseovarius autotrophicus]|uniref:pilus assembly protein TadG-related protein n=1 Tax=Roseovarius autotrophicus TaxID=2824121 RepID=UPI001B35AC6D|nr:pilus assembly protein TadG-related protein [Roseovarius autotrophicus]